MSIHNSDGGYADVPESETFRERVERDHTELMDKLHRFHDALLTSEQQGNQALDQLGAIMLQSLVRRSEFIVRDADALIMPGDILFDEMIWEPKRHAPAAFLVDTISVRHPRLASKKYGVEDPTKIMVPNDIFIELHLKSGEVNRYLLQDPREELDEGAIGYTDGEAIQFDPNELQDPMVRQGLRRPNLFRVIGDHWHVPVRDSSQLKQLIIDDSALSQHPKIEVE